MMFPIFRLATWATVLLTSQKALCALDLNIKDVASIKKAASTVAHNMMSHYHGDEPGNIPGNISDNWWESAAMFMTLIQYWYWTGDTTYNSAIRKGMLWQKGRDDFFPSNHSMYLGNDDQMFWGLAAMTAAELNFPEEEDQPSWLSLAQGVFNTQMPRWDSSGCGGGMRWQIWPYQGGYTMKNAITNGGLFQLAARLGRYTKNETYIHWAERLWDWSATTPLLKSNWEIADSTRMQNNCEDHGDQQWTYNYGAYIGGAAFMYNFTNGGHKWKAGINGLLGTTWNTFFKKKAMSEVWCEQTMTCDRNEDMFKGLLSTWLTWTATVAPYTAEAIIPRIQTSAIGAAHQCFQDKSCGRRWNQDEWDGSSRMESDMSALGVFSSSMLAHRRGAKPLTPETGATSKSNPNAGMNEDAKLPEPRAITVYDIVGAVFVTVLGLAGWIWLMAWLICGGDDVSDCQKTPGAAVWGC